MRVAIYLRNESSVFLEVQPERIEERSEDCERESLTAQKAARATVPVYVEPQSCRHNCCESARRTQHSGVR